MNILRLLKNAHSSLRTFSDNVSDDDKYWSAFDASVLKELEKTIQELEGNVPCVVCGRRDLPLHYNRKYPECFTG